MYINEINRTKELRHLETVDMRSLISQTKPTNLVLRFEGYFEIPAQEWACMNPDVAIRYKIIFRECKTGLWVHYPVRNYWEWRHCYKNQTWFPPAFKPEYHGELHYSEIQSLGELWEDYGFFQQLQRRNIHVGECLSLSFKPSGGYLPDGSPKMAMHISWVVGGEFLPSI